MHKIAYRPKFCSLQPKMGQLERIMKKKDSFGNICAFLMLFTVFYAEEVTLAK